MNTPLERLLLLSTFLALIVPHAQAQVQKRASINFAMGIPVAEFSDNVDNLGFGINLNGGLGLRPAPVMIGIDIGYLIYGFERRSVPFSTTIPDVRVDVETTNNIALAHIFFRFQPQLGAVQPYAEGLFGFKYLFTQTSVENRNTGESIASSTNFDDFASSYGIGGGIEFRVFEGTEDNSRPSIMVNLGIRYLLGSSAEYLDRGSIMRDGLGNVIFDVAKSQTDLLMPTVGATFLF